MTNKTLLIIAHAPSINTQALAKAVFLGATADELSSSTHSSSTSFSSINSSFTNSSAISLSVYCQTPQETTANDVLKADAVILGTTENLGYMAGMTKDFFDRCYYQLLDKKQGMPYAIYIRAGHDGTGTQRALATINNGLRWQLVQQPLILRGDWSDDFVDEVEELGMAMVAGLEMGIF